MHVLYADPRAYNAKRRALLALSTIMLGFSIVLAYSLIKDLDTEHVVVVGGIGALDEHEKELTAATVAA